MRALMKVARGPGKVELSDIPEPRVLPDQVKIAIRAAGICGTDIHIYHDRFRNEPPVVLGHEYAGEIVEVGLVVKSLKVGDRVVAGNPASTCGRCFQCKAGNPYLCPEYSGRGYFLDGGFAEYIAVEERCCHVIPDGVSFDHASLCEPLAGVLRCMTERISVRPLDCVLVCGAGPIGLLAARVSNVMGARTIVTGLSRDERRLETARRMGVDAAINVERDDLPAAVDRLSNRGGADIVVECSGSKSAFTAALGAVRKGGVIAQIGIYPGPFDVDVNQVVMKELAVIGSYGQTWQCWETALRMIRDRVVDVRLLIDAVLPIGDWKKGFELTDSGEASKVILRP